MHVVVYGAGAVGSVLGGMLCLHKHDVHLVCRKAHADAINRAGLHIRSATGDYVVNPRATDSLGAEDLSDDTCVFLTAKCHDTEECAREMAAIVPKSAPVVSFQNGVGNEDVLAASFENVYGGVCRMTCQMVQPGNASFRRLGRIVVGKYPKGNDAFTRALCAAFDEVGFEGCPSRNIVSDKWLKLVVNTQSVFNAVIDPRDHESNEFFELKACILEETQKILRASKIRPRSCDGKDNSIDEMIADLRRPRMPRTDRGMKVHNSTWQDLYLKRDAIESPRFHEPFIEMARAQGVPAPCNEVALEFIVRCHREETGPGAVRLSEVLEAIEKRCEH